MSRAVGDDVVAVGARDAVDAMLAETEVVEKSRRRGFESPPNLLGSICHARWARTASGRSRGEDVAVERIALVRCGRR